MTTATANWHWRGDLFQLYIGPFPAAPSRSIVRLLRIQLGPVQWFSVDEREHYSEHRRSIGSKIERAQWDWGNHGMKDKSNSNQNAKVPV